MVTPAFRLPAALWGAVFAVLLLAACHHPADPIPAPPDAPPVVEYEYLEEPLLDAWRVCSAFTYYPDGATDYWQSPRETEARAGGDCEDASAWLVYHLGRDSSLCVVQMNGRSTYHAVVFYRGVFLESQEYYLFLGEYEFTLIRIYDYAEVMARATANGTK